MCLVLQTFTDSVHSEKTQGFVPDKAGRRLDKPDPGADEAGRLRINPRNSGQKPPTTNAGRANALPGSRVNERANLIH